MRRSIASPSASASDPRQRSETMPKVVIITGPGFQDHDVVYTYYRAKEEGYDVDIATKDGEAVVGKYGIHVPMDKRARPNIPFDALDVAKYDAVILTGGHEAPDPGRHDKHAPALVARIAATRNG